MAGFVGVKLDKERDNERDKEYSQKSQPAAFIPHPSILRITPMSSKTYRVRVHGRVTGVGFRYSALAEAERVGGLRGWIRNADARTVECLVQGEEAEVLALLAWLHGGPPGAEVTECDAEEVTRPPRLETFHVRA